MADKENTTAPGANPPPATTLALVTARSPVPAGHAAPGTHAAVTAQKHGGLRGGKKRKDGLVPGSPEALEADRAKDAARKKLEREQSRTDPPPIPPAGSPVAAQAGHLGAVPGAEGLPPVPWEAKQLQPLIEQIVPTVELALVKQIEGKAIKGNIPKELFEDIRKATAWNPAAKKMLEVSAAQVASKYLNKTGVSAEYQPEVALAVAVAGIAAGHMKVLSRLDELIKQANPPALDNKKAPDESGAAQK